MKKALIIFSILFIQIMYCFGQTNSVYFETGSYELSNQTKAILDSVFLEIQKKHKQEQMALIGYTDSDGSVESNQILSLNRAREVKKYLQDKGLKNRINLFAKGEIQLAKNKGTKKAKLQSRRVEIIQNYSNNNDAFKALEQKFQDFIISTDKDITLTCEKGTKIRIPKGSFEGVNPAQEVTFKVQEFYSKASFISANLSSMTANGELLESRGMLNIEAYQKDKKLNLKKGKTIEIEFRDRKEGDSTQLFNGIKQNGEIVWDTIPQLKTTDDGGVKLLGSFIQERKIHEIYGKMVDDKMLKINYHKESDSTEVDKASFKSIFNMVSKFQTEYDSNQVLAKIEQDKILATQKEKLSNMNQNEKLNFMLTQKLGWINCDRFYNINRQKINLIVEYQGNFVPDVSLIFKDINSVLHASYIRGNKIIFRNIPVDMNVEFVGVFKSKDMKKTYFANLKTKTREGFEEKLEFNLLNQNEFENQINELN